MIEMKNRVEVFHEDSNKEQENTYKSNKISKSEQTNKKQYDYEDAIDLAGNGRYNVSLTIVLSFVIISMIIDMFGFMLVVTASKCDFDIGITEYSILTSMPFVGTIIMAYPWGYFADTKGRRATLLLAMGVNFILSVLNSFSPNWIVMAVFKLVGASFCSAAQSASYVLLGESCGARVRNFYMLLMTSAMLGTSSIIYTLSYLTLKLDFNYEIECMNIGFTPWRLLIIIFALPSGLSVLLLLFFNESPKFMANIGKTSEAIEILKNIYVRNGGNADNYPVEDIVLEDNKFADREKQSIIRSILNQTLPIFKPPLLAKTIQLFYLNLVVYSTNSFSVWFPYLGDIIFLADANEVPRHGVCEFISTKNEHIQNITSDIIEPCSSKLNDRTIIIGIIYGVIVSILNLLMSLFADKKKCILTVSLMISIIGGIGSQFTSNSILTTVSYLVITLTALGMGVISAYFVEFYPTSHRGMSSCLGVMIARSSSLISINIVGATIVNYCSATFYLWLVYIFSGILVTWWCLPPDNNYEKKAGKGDQP